MVPHAVAVEFTGQVQKTIWEAADKSAVIASVLDGDGAEKVVKGPLGNEFKLSVGVPYRFHGRWVRHEKHGQQFEFATYCPVVPHDRRGVIAYLVSIAKGIGEKRAAQLWDAFGDSAVDVLRKQPERVAEADIMGLPAAVQASQSLHNAGAFQEVKIDLLGLFAGRGFQEGKLINACLQQWGALAPHIIRRNPYALLLKRMPSAGFKRCDRLYLNLGLPRNRLKRQALSAWYAIKTDQNGHTWHNAKLIASKIQEAINGADPIRALRLAVRSRLLAKHKDAEGVWIADHKKARNEAIVADKIRIMIAGDDEAAVLWPSLNRCEELSPHQRQQADKALFARLGLLTGTPGTGKTYTIAALIKILARDFGTRQIAVCAPTGKAAVRVSAALAKANVLLRATTIHTLLEIGRNGHDGGGWEFKRNENNPLDELFIIVDESSMIDTDLAASLFEAIGPKTHLLFVGDPYQLPPVGHGAPLRDMIAAGVPNGHLTEIQRNAGLIVRACAAIKEGKDFMASDRFSPNDGLNLRHIEGAAPESQIETLIALLDKLRANERGWDHFWDVQVILATNNSGPLSRVPINRLLQAHLNPNGCGHLDHKFRVKDKIICLRNHMAIDADDPQGESHYVANGEIGEVVRVDQPRKIICRFTSPERFIAVPVVKKKGEECNDDSAADDLDSEDATPNFDLAYAVTCHKSQGSEWPVVILLIDAASQARRICSREWIYTALSRASQLCITVGRFDVVQRMTKRVILERRKTLLADLITERA